MICLAWLSPPVAAQVLGIAVVLLGARAADLYGLVRIALKLSSIRKLGLLKALAFAAFLRKEFMPAFPTAKDALDEAVMSRTSYSFVDPPTTKGVLFLPGGLVDPVAYAPMLRRLHHVSGATVACVKHDFRHPLLTPTSRLRAIMRRHPGIKTW